MNLYEILDRLNIQYSEIEHKKIYAIEKAQSIKSRISGIGCKSLFLTDRKGKYILIVLEDNKNANIRYLSKICNTSHLSFASKEELKNILNLEQGSVSPLGIVNDIENKVLILIDKCLENKKILVHPNTNTKTISIKYNDLIKFIDYENHKYILI